MFLIFLSQTRFGPVDVNGKLRTPCTPHLTLHITPYILHPVPHTLTPHRRTPIDPNMHI
jgi:hypothetical protein